ncbi:NAD-dependent D-arabinose 1-dehydrogenase [Aureococcus anophagefferens]|uniref:NAD-dependent D-arabinose 1-dehydrogenase n=1 Tax=Aureococcus anophagefferens TaxID=44056 RepID=A0ABR1G0F1_AURAN
MVDTLPIVVAVACVVVAGLVVAATRHTRAAAAAATGPLALKTADLAVGDILVGTSPLGGIVEELSDDEAEEVVERCVEVGFRHFDTAPHYGLGVAESRLGAGLRRGCAKLTRTRRAALKILDEEVRVWTKVGRVIKTKDTVAAGDVVEADNLPGSSTTIYLRVDLRGIHIFNPTSIPWAASARASSSRASGATTRVAGLEAAALAGSLPGLAAVRAAATKRPAPAGAETPGAKKRRGDAGAAGAAAAELSVGLNDAAVALRILDATNPTRGDGAGGPPALDSVMLAGRWHLLDQTGAPVLAACAARGVRVEIAGAYASGLLAGGPNYEYKPATPAHVARRDAWAALAADHGVSLKAAALKFAFLPAAVSKVALGLASTAFVDETVDIIAEANAVPAALWKDAVARGLLAPDLLAL